MTKGIVFLNGKAIEMDFPIETYAVALAWAMDMLRAINEHSKFRKWLLRLCLGKYAFRELVGLRDAVEGYGYNTTFSYSLENMDYHKEEVHL